MCYVWSNIFATLLLQRTPLIEHVNRYRRKRPKVDASILDSALSHTRRSDSSEKKKKIPCPLLDVFACEQVSSPRLYRLREACLLDLRLFRVVKVNSGH